MSSSSSPVSDSQVLERQELPSLRWRSWPLVNGLPWSLLVPVGVAVIGALVGWAVSDWLWGVVAGLCLVIALKRFFEPVTFEVGPSGLFLHTWRRKRRVPWSAVRSYAVRETGVALFDRPDPTPIDVMRCQFLPAEGDTDELLCALREYLPHAEELSWGRSKTRPR